MLQFRAIQLICLIFLFLIASAPALGGGDDQPKISAERRELMQKIDYSEDEAVRIADRLRLVSAMALDKEVVVKVRLAFADASGEPIEGARIRLGLYCKGQMFDSELDVAARKSGSVEPIVISRTTPIMNGYELLPGFAMEAFTDSEGVAEFRLTPPDAELGFAPGEYYGLITFRIKDQSFSTREAILSDPSIIDMNALRIQEARMARPRSPGPGGMPPFNPLPIGLIRKDLLDEIARGARHVNDCRIRFTVGHSSIFVDDGSLLFIWELEDLRDQELEARRLLESLEIDHKNEKDADKRVGIAERIKHAQGKLREIREDIAFRGGSITVGELALKQELERWQRAVLREMHEALDPVLLQYICLLKGDLPYWYWKASTLYGNTIYSAVKFGYLPWDNPDKPLSYYDEAGELQHVTDLSSWRSYLKRRLQIGVNGDPATWPENGFDGPSAAVRRGGFYSPWLLEKMLKDVDEFDPMDYLSMVRPNPYTGWKAVYGLKEQEWIRFERQFRVEIGHSPASEDSDWEEVKLRAFPVAGNMELKSTRERIDSIDFASIYSQGIHTFDPAMKSLRESFEAIAWMPVTYRWWLFQESRALDSSEADVAKLGGEDLPKAALRTAAAAYTSYKSGRETTLRQLERLRPTFRNLLVRWATSEGQNRNWPKDWRDARYFRALESLRRRYEPHMEPEDPDKTNPKW